MDDWYAVIHASVGPSTLTNYTQCYKKYLQWLDDRPPTFAPHLHRLGPMCLPFAILYLATLYEKGLGHSSALMFQASIGFQRTLHGLPRFDSSILTQVNKAFSRTTANNATAM